MSDWNAAPALTFPPPGPSLMVMITLHVLGAGGAVPTAERGPAAYWVVVDGRGVLLDPGPGALVRLLRQPGGPSGSVDAIDTVLLSHLHLDHTADLAPLLFAQHSVLAGKKAPSCWSALPAPRGIWIASATSGATGCSRGCGTSRYARSTPASRLPCPVAWRRPCPPTIRCRGSPVARWGGRSTIARATGWPTPATRAPAGTRHRAIGACDLLLAECSTPDDLAVDTHLSPAGVIDLIGNTRPGRVVLTHLYPLVAVPGTGGGHRRGHRGPHGRCRDGDIFDIPEPREPTT